MRLPINFLLYLASIAMLGCAGWLFVQATIQARPLSGEENGPSRMGFDIAEQRVKEGQELDPRRQGWNYDNRTWWQQFTEVNLTGKLPPPPEVELTTGPTIAPEEVETPLDQIFHLISLMYHNVQGGAETHVVLRYREDASVQIPESVARRAGT